MAALSDEDVSAPARVLIVWVRAGPRLPVVAGRGQPRAFAAAAGRSGRRSSAELHHAGELHRAVPVVGRGSSRADPGADSDADSGSDARTHLRCDARAHA